MDAGTVAALLELQSEWGVDVLLDEMPHDRFAEYREQHAVGSGQDESALAASVRVQPTEKAVTPPTRTDVVTEQSVLETLASVSTLETLAETIDRFTVCPLRATATNTVLARGPLNAHVMVIGDAPDADEDRSGLPFSGEIGGFLDKMLASIGLRREEMVLSPALPWRPPGGRPPSRAEVALCRPLLLKSIALYNPRRLVLCGGLAVRMLLGPDVKPARARGSWRSVSLAEVAGTEKPVMAMRHPSQLRAGAGARREIWDDLLLLAVTLEDIGSSPDVMME